MSGTISNKSRPKSALNNALWNSFATIWGIAISFISVPLLIHHLGTAQYGIYLLIGSLTGILGVMSFGLGEGTLRYVAFYYGGGDLTGVNRVFGATLSFYLLVGVLASALLFSFAPTIASWMNIPGDQHASAVSLVRLSGLVFSIGIITSAFAAMPMAVQRYDISSKLGICLGAVRSAGLILLVLSGFGVFHLILWDVIVGCAALCLYFQVARNLLPGVRGLPSFNLRGLREIWGYSIYSFLTSSVHTLHRESGKLLLARFMGPVPVAFFSAPEGIVQRIHMVVASGSEPLVPRFSANRDSKIAETLFWNATWSALAVSLVLFVPFFVLVPDFLRLWINPEIARHGSVIGQLLALYLIAQGAFTPVAAYFRGIGKPWFVTLVIFCALIATVLMALYLIPAHGPAGIAWAYLAGAVAPLCGVVVGSLYAFGKSRLIPLLRTVGIPLVIGGLACGLGMAIRNQSGELTWIGLFAHAALLSAITGLLVMASDWIPGGAHAPSRQLFGRLVASRRLEFLWRRMPKVLTK